MSTPGMGGRLMHGIEAAPSPLMTRAEAADYLRVTDRTIDRYVTAGRLTKLRVEGVQSVRFARAEVEALVTPEPAQAE